MRVHHAQKAALTALLLTAVTISSTPVAAAAAPLPPSWGYEVVGTVNQLVGAGQTAAATVDCPAGKVPLGGGVYAGSNDLEVVESFPLGAPLSPSGWLGAVANEGAFATVYDVYAVCAKVPLNVGYEVVGVTNQTVGGGQTGDAWISCSAGKVPLGGGVYTGSNDVRVVETFPLGAPSAPSGWLGTVANEGKQASIFDVYAICARVPARLRYEVVGTVNQLVGPGQEAAATVDCPAGKVPLGGGVYAGNNELRVVETFPLGAPSSPSGWLGTVSNVGTFTDVYDVYVVCAA